MTKHKLFARALYAVMALALVAGLTLVPAMPVSAQTVTSVTPNSGNQGETLYPITIEGSGLGSSGVVDFGSGITYKGCNVWNDTTIEAYINIAPDAPPGLRDVIVTIYPPPVTTVTLYDAFTVVEVVVAPTVTEVSPDSGDQGETLDVTITGTSFSGATLVSFGAGITTNSFIVDSATEITANIYIASAATPGAGDVSVTTPGGTATLTAGFTVVEVVVVPTVTAVNPASGYQGDENLVVTITGTGFGSDFGSVDFGTGITFVGGTWSDTTIEAYIDIDPAATPGLRDVTVTTAPPPGETATLTDGFTVLAVVSPNSGYQGEYVGPITITGSGFGSAFGSVDFGPGIAFIGFNAWSDTKIEGVYIDIASDAPPGLRDVIVTIYPPPVTTVTLYDAFTVVEVVVAPTVTEVSPDSGDQGETLDVTITGTSFSGATLVSFGAGITTNSFIVDSATEITANIYIDAAATLGTRVVSVTTPAGTGTLPDGFNVEVVPTYALTMVADPVGSGTATDETGNSPYEEGASVSIKAEAAALYQFVNWTATAGVFGDASAAETTFTMPGEAATVTANFTVVAVITWNCPVDHAALIAPLDSAGRPVLSATADLAEVTMNIIGGWFQVLWLDETVPGGEWYLFISLPEYAGTNTLNTLEPGKGYYVVVSAPCELTIPQ